MAVGRISGPLLARNLFRDGVPLAFYNTSSSEPPVLYLDVVNGRIGVQTDAPSYALDVVGTSRATNIRATTSQVGNLIFSGNTVTTDVGAINLAPSGMDFVNITAPTNIYGQTIVDAGIESKTTATGSLIVRGGLAVTSSTVVGNKLTVLSDEQATDLDYDGSLIVKGGVSVAKDLWVGGILHAVLSTSTVATVSSYADNVKVDDPGLGLYYPMLAGDTNGYISAKASPKFNFSLNDGRLTSPFLTVSSSTNSTSSDSGSLVVTGGVGIGQDLTIDGIIRSNNTTTSIDSTSGAAVIAGGVGIGGDLNVAGNINAVGNIHAVGNITAEGNIQLGNSATTDTLVVGAEIDSDLIPKADNTYKVGSTTRTWAEGYFDTLYSNIIESQTGSINISPADNLLQVNANIRVSGDKPLGTAPVVTNVLYVTMDGSDTNDGRAEDPSRACRTISGALRSPYYQPGTSIKVAPGHYLEQNPMLMLPYTSIIGSDLRTTVIEAINKTQDLFHVQSGCYLFGMQFLNGRSGVLPGSYAKGYNRGAYCIAFPPQVDGNKIDTFHSPYIQNCTNQTGPWLMDGTMFIPNQTVQVPLAVGTGTWAANTTTIVVTVSTGTVTTGMSVNSGQQDPGFFNARTLLLANKPFIQEQVVAYVNQTFPGFEYQQAKCFRDVGIIVENIAYDSAFGGNEKSREAGLAYYDGVTSVIAGEESQTVDAIVYINTLAQDIITNTPASDLLSGAGLYSQVINDSLNGGSIASNSIMNNIGIITDIINNGPDSAPTLYKGVGHDAANISAEVLLQANRQFIQDDVLAWITNTYPTFDYNQDLCYRDVGLIVDAISQDILLGGNSKTIEAALSYWEGGYNQIVGEETTTTQAISHARDISVQIIANTSVTAQSGNTSTQVTNTYFENGHLVEPAVIRNFDIINTIIVGGIEVAPTEYHGGGLFASTGVQIEETHVAPAVTNVTSLGGDQYEIELDTATIGFGTNATLYFGNTNVFPVQDADIPDRWAQRRIDTKGAMGGMLVDGSVVSDRSPVGSMVLNAFTQVAQGGRGIHIINNGYAQLVSIFTIFCNIAVECDTGGIASITNSNSNFGDTCLIAKSYGEREFSGTVINPSYPTFLPNGEYYPSGYWPQGGQVMIFVPDSANRPHIALTMEVEPPASYINDQGLPGFLTAAPTTSTLSTGSITISNIDITDIAIGQTLYVRDQYGRTTDGSGIPYVSTGTIITDINYQEITLSKAINQGGGDSATPNYFTLYTCGNAYYTVLSSNLTTNPVTVGDSVIPTSQQGREVNALNFIDDILQAVISNTAFTSTNTTVAQTILPLVTGGEDAGAFISDRISIISDIALNGTGAAPTITESGTLPDGVGSAITLINANIDFVAAEVSESIPVLDYSQTLCSRDTGLIVDAISQDLLFAGTSQSTFAGLQYWSQSTLTGDIPNELNTTTAAINYLSSLAQKIVVSDTSGTRYQTTVTQVVSASTGTSAEAEIISTDFAIVTDIINNGTSGVTDRIVSNGTTASTDVNVVNAYTLLQNNKDYLKAEVYAYIEETQLGFNYNVSKCERDVELIINSIVLDLAFYTDNSSQSSFAGLQYWAQSGLTGQIPEEITTTTNAILFLKSLAKQVIVNDTSGTRYTSGVQITNPGSPGSGNEVAKLENEFTTIVNILSSGTVGVTDLIEINGIDPSGATDTQNAYYLLQANKDYMVDEVIAYIDATNIGYSYNRITCRRDVGYMLDSVSFDLLYGGNKQAVQSGVYYYNFDATTSSIPNEIEQTTAAFTFIKNLVVQIARGDSITPLQTEVTFVSGDAGTNFQSSLLAAKIDYIIEIINDGPSAVGTKEPISLNKTIDVDELNAASLVLANRYFIAAETTAWIRQNLQFQYDTAKCSRDVEYMIDSISIDLLYGGNKQAVQSGVYYFNYSTSTAAISALEYVPIQNALGYLKELISDIVSGTEVASPYQTDVPQVTAITSATSTQITNLQGSVDYIVDIIINGPDVADPKEPIGLTASSNSDITNAVYAMSVNRDFIRAEIIAYLNTNYLTTAAKDKCIRDVKLILQQLVYDLETGGNYYSVYSGLSYWSRANTYHVVQLGENISNPNLMPDGATVNFYQRSYMSASGYTFEYVGAGMNYGALPQVGRADPVQTKEVIQIDNGKVFFTSTDQNGDFRIGPGLVISQATGVLSGRTFTKSLFANLTPFILAVEAIS